MATAVNLESRGGPWKRLFATNVLAADAAFVSGGLKGRATPFSAAANLAIISMTGIPTSEWPSYAMGEAMPNSIMFRFLGENASNDSFSARIWGLAKGIDLVGTSHTDSWEATLLAELLITLGNITGTTGTLIEASTSFEADTIVRTYGATEDIAINSPANDLRGAWARIDNLAFPLLAVEFDKSVNSGTQADACNALWRPVW